MCMKVIKHQSYRSEGRGVNQTDDRVHVTIDCSVNEFNRYFRNDTNLRRVEIADTAIEACKKIEQFHFQVFCTGPPLSIDGKPINHSILNEAYDLSYKVLQQIEESMQMGGRKEIL